MSCVSREVLLVACKELPVSSFICRIHVYVDILMTWSGIVYAVSRDVVANLFSISYTYFMIQEVYNLQIQHVNVIIMVILLNNIELDGIYSCP